MSAAGNRNREILQKEKANKSEGKHEGVYRELVRLKNQPQSLCLFFFNSLVFKFSEPLLTFWVDYRQCHKYKKTFIKDSI